MIVIGGQKMPRKRSGNMSNKLVEGGRQGSSEEGWRVGGNEGARGG